MNRLSFLMAAMFAGMALAQEPAVDTSSNPAVDTSMQAAPMEAPGDSGGTTIVGERESPIGLYIMPWRNSAAEEGIDRPARLLEEEPLAIDPGTFRRQLDYYNALSAHRAAVATTPTKP
jgi:hypothetical protein